MGVLEGAVGEQLDQEIARLTGVLDVYMQGCGRLPNYLQLLRQKNKQPGPLHGFWEMVDELPDWQLVCAKRRKALLDAGMEPVLENTTITLKLQPEDLGGLIIFKFYDALAYAGGDLYDAWFAAEPDRYPLVRAILEPQKTLKEWTRDRAIAGHSQTEPRRWTTEEGGIR